MIRDVLFILDPQKDLDFVLIPDPGVKKHLIRIRNTVQSN
jgi:hypothetical protein